jgi:hypothetical protein
LVFHKFVTVFLQLLFVSQQIFAHLSKSVKNWQVLKTLIINLPLLEMWHKLALINKKGFGPLFKFNRVKQRHFHYGAATFTSQVSKKKLAKYYSQ